jgi:hypothetical protein
MTRAGPEGFQAGDEYPGLVGQGADSQGPTGITP